MTVSGLAHPHFTDIERILYSKVNKCQLHRRLWLMTMENGTRWTAKPIEDQEHVRWWMKIENQLRARGFQEMPQIWTDGDQWMLTPFIEGKVCSYRNLFEAEKAITCLAQFHQLGQRLPVPLLKQQMKFLLYDRLYDRICSFYKLLSHIHRIEGEWGEFLRKYVPLYYEDALKAWKRVQSSGIYDLTVSDVNNRAVVHRDLANHNWMLDQTGKIWLIDFETAGYDAQIGDLWQMLARILYEHQWSPAVFSQLLMSYHTIRPLSVHEKKVLYSLLSFPNDFMREAIGLWKRKPGYTMRTTFPFLQKIAPMRDHWKEQLRQISSV